VTLSVSSSTSGSSALMVSPTFLNQVPIVASETDSPNVGTRISVAMAVSFSVQ
jgi:sensor domain CHASE-containing protein